MMRAETLRHVPRRLGMEHNRSLRFTAGSFALVTSAAMLTVFLAWSVYDVDRTIGGFLPCDASVITDPDVLIDPAGYDRYPDSVVAASEAHEACVDASRELFDLAGITGRTSWPALVFADVAAFGLVAAGWAMAPIGRLGPSRRTVLGSLAALTVITFAAASVQFRFAETIDVVTTVTN